jgi:hypothetical protein
MDVGPENLGRCRRDDFKVCPGHGLPSDDGCYQKQISSVFDKRKVRPMGVVATISGGTAATSADGAEGIGELLRSLPPVANTAMKRSPAP